MSSTILQTQERQSASKYINTADRRYDFLFPPAHDSIRAPLAQDRSEIDITSKSAPGNVMTQKCNQTNYLGDVYLRCNLNAPVAGNYCKYAGLSIVQRVLIRNQQTIMEYDYSPVMDSLLSNMEENKRQEILRLSGGTAHNAGEVIVPIPCFWSSLAHHEDKEAHPIAVHMLDSPIEIEVTFRNVADIHAAGATPNAQPFQSVVFCQMVYHTTSELRSIHSNQRAEFVYKSIDWQTNTNNTVPNATVTNIDVSAFHNDIKDLEIKNVLASDITTAKDYYNKKPISELTFIIDGSEYLRSRSGNQVEYENLLSGYRGTPLTANMGDNLILPFSYKSNNSVNRDYAGSFATLDSNQQTLQLRQDNGADCSVSVLANVNAVWTIENGHLTRKY